MSRALNILIGFAIAAVLAAGPLAGAAPIKICALSAPADQARSG